MHATVAIEPAVIQVFNAIFLRSVLGNRAPLK